VGKSYNKDVVQEVRAVLPGGRFIGAIESLRDTEESSNGNYQIIALLRITEPKEFVDSPWYEQFVIGDTNDPGADLDETWRKSYAARRYRSLLEAAAVSLSGDTDEDAGQAAGKLIGFTIERKAEPEVDKYGQPNRYAGSMRSNVVAFWRVGTRAPGVDTEVEVSASAKQAAATGASDGSAVPRWTPAGSTNTAGGNAVVVAGENVQTQATPIVTPAAAPTRARVGRQTAAAAIQCPLCKVQIGRDDFRDHVGNCKGPSEVPF